MSLLSRRARVQLLLTSISVATVACTPLPELLPVVGSASFVAEPATGCPATPMLPDSLHGSILDSTRRAFLVRNGYCTYFIPEFHDEQRLTDNASGYGPIAYSYAHPVSGSLTTHAGYDKRWVNVASVWVTSSPLFPAYNGLHLQNGANCVYLWHNHPGSGESGQPQWRGRIVPPNPANNLCDGGTGGVVPVAFEQPSTSPADYPPVTRWMEGQSRHPFLGVRCGDMWCIIGPGGAALASSHMGSGGWTYSPQSIIRGWHDDQTLGVPTAPGASPFGILATGPKISIIPHEALGTRTVGSFLTGAWIPVATVIVPIGVTLPPKYGSIPGYGLTTGPNLFEIRATGSYPHQWRVRLTNAAYPTGHEFARPVKWQDHSAFTTFVPATARWRWFDTDEEMWTRCGIGCCMIQPE